MIIYYVDSIAAIIKPDNAMYLSAVVKATAPELGAAVAVVAVPFVVDELCDVKDALVGLVTLVLPAAETGCVAVTVASVALDPDVAAADRKYPLGEDVELSTPFPHATTLFQPVANSPAHHEPFEISQ